MFKRPSFVIEIFTHQTLIKWITYFKKKEDKNDLCVQFMHYTSSWVSNWCRVRFMLAGSQQALKRANLFTLNWNGPIYLNRIGYVRSNCEMQLLDCIKTEIHRNLIIVNKPACSVGIMGLINCMELEYRRIHW